MTSFLNTVPKRKKSAEQLVFSVNESIALLSADTFEDSSRSQTEQNLAKCLVEIKQLIFGDSEQQVETASDDERAREVVRHIQSENMLLKLIENLEIIPFESRKDTVYIFNALLRRNICNFQQYIAENNQEVLDKLISGYNSNETALHSGSMLRECTRYEALVIFILRSPHFWLFFDKFVHLSNFDIASDAFNTLKELLTIPRNKQLAHDFLEVNYDLFITKYESLLQSENYVTRMRSLKLLSELLTDRGNFNIMIKYIDSRKNLKTIMNLLKSKSANIQLETFHIFKIFVANPHKSNDVATILSQNKTKLIAYLENFQTEKDDPQFVDEKRLLIETLKQMPTILLSKSSSERMKLDAVSGTDTPPPKQHQQPPQMQP